VAGAAATRSGERPTKPRSHGSLPLSAAATFLVLSAGLALIAGCSLDDLPENPSFVTVQPAPKRVTVPGEEPTERGLLIDGIATDPEWAEIPYSYVAVGPENGNQGGSFLVAIKAVHDTTSLFMLVQWPDAAPDQMGPRLVWDPERNLTSTGCDTPLVQCSSWDLVEADEDRVSIMWDLGDAADGRHLPGSRPPGGLPRNMHPLSGAVDVWQWRAARTNLINYPAPSNSNIRVGFADDGYADGAGRVADQGTSFYRDNYRPSPAPRRQRPGAAQGPDRARHGPAADHAPERQHASLRVRVRRSGDHLGGESFDCTSRHNPCREFNQEDVVEWTPGDDLSGCS
jgi:hypothetical protein